MSHRLGPPNVLDLVPASAVSKPRLYLDPTGFLGDLLDGAWWPRSIDISAELPGLVLALDGIHGAVMSVGLGADGWRHGPERLRIDGRWVGVAYFASQPASLLTVLCDHGDRINLLVVAPLSSKFDAEAAMLSAATTGNRMTAAYRTASRPHASDADGMRSDEYWSESGHL